MRLPKLFIKKMICHIRGIRKFGSNVYVSLNCEIVNPKRLILGDNVVIEKHARIIVNGKDAEIKIGDDTTIYPYALLKTNGGKIEIGKNCSVNDYCILYGHGGLKIGDEVHIASHTIIVPMNHIFKDPNVSISSQGEERLGIEIEDDVWIGVGVRILDGVRIGKGSVIGAGAVVTKDIPAYSVAVGVPARVIKTRK